LKSNRQGSKKSSQVSGEVQLQFSLIDPSNPSANPEEIERRLRSMIQFDAEDNSMLSRSSTGLTQNDPDGDHEDDADSPDESDSPSQLGPSDRKVKKKKLARLRRKSIAVRAYEFMGVDSDISGIVFMEVVKIVDLPPERNSEWNTSDQSSSTKYLQ